MPGPVVVGRIANTWSRTETNSAAGQQRHQPSLLVCYISALEASSPVMFILSALSWSCEEVAPLHQTAQSQR